MPMKLSLSVRVAESFSDKTQATMSLEGLADLAVEHGYAALCMRASQVGIHTPADEVRSAAGQIRRRGLAVSMVTGDFPIPQNSDESPAALRNITPYLDLAAALDADLLRISMKSALDIPYAQRAADEAAERGMRLAHQCHTRSLFEQVDLALEVVRRVGRRNFGITYEPANLETCREEYGAATIRRLAPHLFNVYLQNQRAAAEGPETADTWGRGPFRFHHVPMWDPSGLDFAAVFAALDELSYDGYVTIHQAFAGLSGAGEAAARSAAYLRTLARFDR